MISIEKTDNDLFIYIEGFDVIWNRTKYEVPNTAYKIKSFKSEGRNRYEFFFNPLTQHLKVLENPFEYDEHSLDGYIYVGGVIVKGKDLNVLSPKWEAPDDFEWVGFDQGFDQGFEK